MEEIVKLIPLLLIALLVEPSIILFILVPPFLFGSTFALIEWASLSFDPLRLVEMLQIGMYTGTTAMISEFVPLFLAGVSLVLIRKMYKPTSWQFGLLGIFLGALYGLLHVYLTTGHSSDIIGLVAFMNGASAWLIDRYQKRMGLVPLPPQQLALAPHTSGDLTAIAIHSDRLDLQSIELSLAQTVFETFTPEVSRFMMPRAPMIPAESEQFLRETLIRMKRGEEIVFSIHAMDTGRFLGMCGIHTHADAATPELGIWLREDAQGHGYGTEAIHALIRWGSEHLVCDHFVYPVVRHNARSRAVAESNGGTVTHEHVYSDGGGNPLDTVIYTIPRYHPDPATRHAKLTLWITQGATGVSLSSKHYRLEREQNIRLDPKPRILMQAYTITGRYLTVRDQRIRQRPKAWIEAGTRIQTLLEDPNQTLVFFNKDAAIALAISRINATVSELLSIEIISAIALDPIEPTITNSHDPLASVTMLASIPSNYYVLVFAINGRKKYIYHFRSNGELIFEDIHTMGVSTPQQTDSQQQLS